MYNFLMRRQLFNKIVFGLVGLLFFVSNCDSLTCLKCTGKGDDLCVTDPGAISSGDVTVDCPDLKYYCVIVRTEYTDIPGQVIAFKRDCEEDPLVKSGVRTDNHYVKIYTSCQTGRCNSGDGSASGTGGGNSGLPSDLIIVPEKSKSSSLASWSFTTAILLTLFATFFNAQ